MNTLKLIRNHTGKLIPLGFSILNPFNTAVIIRNAFSLLFSQQWNNYILKNNKRYIDLAQKSLDWIKHSQNTVGSGGVGCYEFYRWTKGYPEVTGYIIPTFWDAYHLYGDEEYKTRAIRMADWELKLQKPEGGWEGFYEGDSQPPVVFNSGQVLRGLIRTF